MGHVERGIVKFSRDATAAVVGGGEGERLRNTGQGRGQAWAAGNGRGVERGDGRASQSDKGISYRECPYPKLYAVASERAGLLRAWESEGKRRERSVRSRTDS